MSSSVKTILAIVVLAGAAVGFYLYQQGNQATPGKAGAAGKAKMAGAAAMRIVTVETAESRMGRIKERLALTGALKPKEQVNVTPKTAGRVVRILVNVGDTVRKDTLIAELEDDELQQQVNRAKASINVAAASLSQREAEAANARLNLERAETLLKDGLIPRQQFEAEKTNVQVLAAQVELARAQQKQAEAELRELHIRLDQTKIYSPINGQVSMRNVDMGALVGPSTPIVQIVNINTLVTFTSVPETEVAKMRVGSEATIRVDAMADRPFYGKVARISPVLDPSTRAATVEIEIPNPGMQLRAEMFVRVEMNLESIRDAVLVPRESLVYRGDSSGVYVVDRGQQTFRFIETGLTQEDSVEVLSNLQPGTVVVAKGASMLREGDTMKIVAGPGAGEGEGRRGTRADAEGGAGQGSPGKAAPGEAAPSQGAPGQANPGKAVPAQSSAGPTSTHSQGAKPTMQAQRQPAEGAGVGQ
ncbi:MAG: efflux RND transporter periplasmic adaptor subunit [Bryobacterales bacterium]|nr:efflux RND transporter periplasmic adaptor subunit [Bryobacterales bacterium]